MPKSDYSIFFNNQRRDGGAAEEVFTSMENPSVEAYLAMIQGLAKFNHASRAYKLFEEAQTKGFLVDIDTYNAIIKVVPFLRESSELRFVSVSYSHVLSVKFPQLQF